MRSLFSLLNVVDGLIRTKLVRSLAETSVLAVAPPPPDDAADTKAAATDVVVLLVVVPLAPTVSVESVDCCCCCIFEIDARAASSSPIIRLCLFIFDLL